MRFLAGFLLLLFLATGALALRSDFYPSDIDRGSPLLFGLLALNEPLESLGDGRRKIVSR